MATIDTSGRPAYMYDEDTDTWYAISGRVSTSANYVWTGAQQYTNNVQVDGGLTVTSRINVFLNPAARTAAIASPQTGLLTFIRQDAGGNTINRLEYWNGSAWIDARSIPYTPLQPSTPVIGSLWIDSDNDVMSVYNGSSWVALSDPDMVTLSDTQTLTNKTLTSPVINSAITTVSTNAQSGTSYTLSLSDRDKIVELNNSSAISLTVPTNASVPFPTGSSIVLLQTGSGQVTVGGAGVTINGTPGLKLRTQWSSASLIKRGTDTWVLLGDLSA